MTAEVAARVQALTGGSFDWELLARAADWHGVTPLVRARLETVCPDRVPREIAERLRTAAAANARRNVAMAVELARILRLLAAHGIPGLPLKGPVLADTLYGDVSLRQFGDLDLLVRTPDVPAASRLLAAHGYRPQFPLNPRQEAAVIDLRSAHSFIRADGAVVLDLHWGITPSGFSFSPDAARLWERARPVRLAGVETATLAPEDLLASICVHGAKHHWSQLSWLCDVAWLLHVERTVDWAATIAGPTTPPGARRMILVGVRAARLLLGAEIPDGVARMIAEDARVDPLAGRVAAVIRREPGTEPPALVADLFFIRTMVRVRDRLRYCFDHLRPTPLEWALLPLRNPGHPLYYVVRLGRWGWNLLASVLGRVMTGRRRDGVAR